LERRVARRPPDGEHQTISDGCWKASYNRWLALAKERCTVGLVELERAWRAEAQAQLARLLEAQARYEKFAALPLIVLINELIEVNLATVPRVVELQRQRPCARLKTSEHLPSHCHTTI
jgi:hypothetical protein